MWKYLYRISTPLLLGNIVLMTYGYMNGRVPNSVFLVTTALFCFAGIFGAAFTKD